MKTTHRTLMAAMVLIAVLVLTAGSGVSRAAQERGLSEVAPESEKPAAPDSRQAEEVEQELQGLIEDLKELGKDVQETFRKEVLPRVREEIRKLREKLRELEKEREEQHEDPSDARRI
mgnify:CR=1 FL=1